MNHATAGPEIDFDYQDCCVRYFLRARFAVRVGCKGTRDSPGELIIEPVNTTLLSAVVWIDEIGYPIQPHETLGWRLIDQKIFDDVVHGCQQESARERCQKYLEQSCLA